LRYDVYGIGNALVDFIVFVDDSYLNSRGIAKGMMTLQAEPWQEAIADIAPDKMIKCSGGSAANTVAGLVVVGGRACYSGQVGDDPLGEFYREDLREQGVDLLTAGHDDRLTGSCVSMVTPDGERSMLTFLGASVDLDESAVDEDAIADSHFVYIEGYLWDSESARRAAIRAMEAARAAGTRVSFSYSDPFLVQRYADDFRRVSKEYVDLLFCNDQEATMLTGVDDIAKAALELGALVPQVCITLGADGALVSSKQVVRRTPALEVVDLKDTTGAGDLYAAGVLRGLSLKLDLVSASLLGARLAAAIVENVGARLMPEMLLQ
jgi:sugar/nucleoside kinase (ribokinase family)